MNKQRILELTDSLKSRIIGYETVNGFDRKYNKMFADIKKIEDEINSDIIRPETKKVPEVKEKLTAREILDNKEFTFDFYANDKGKFYIINEKNILKLINKGINDGKPETTLSRAMKNMPYGMMAKDMKFTQ
jgi:hypothetical protein